MNKSGYIAKLHCTEGTSDKVYNVELRKDFENGGYLVYFAYGRKGSNLNEGYKIKQASYDKACSIANKLVQSKEKKGYNNVTTSWEVKEFKNQIIQRILEHLTGLKHIDKNQMIKLRNMLKSSDNESKTLAINIINQKNNQLNYVA